MTTPRLSEHFTLEELTRSQLAARRGIAVTVTPGSPQWHNLSRLCADILEPLRRDARKSLFITSGYRPPRLNRLVGGARHSQHVTGQAADFVLTGKSPLWVCRRVVALGLPFDQLIHEFGRWTHVSVALPGVKPRGQCLTAVRRGGRARFLPGLLES